jgi:hypothetical protein
MPAGRRFDIKSPTNRAKGLLMRGRLFLVIVVGLLGLIAVAGCGGDDDGDSATAGNGDTGSVQAQREEFIDQANSLCAKRSAELAVKGKRVFAKVYDEPEGVAARKMAEKVVLPVFEGELEDLKTLTIPPQDGRQVAAVYEAIEEMIEEVKANPTVQNFYPYTKAEKLAKQYGISACGHP